MIIAQNITKSFKTKIKRTKIKRNILENLSIKIESGRINILFGPSGIGKTTLLKCLALLETIESGQLILGNNKYNFPAKTPPIINYPNITMVFQQLLLWPHLTNRENITLSLSSISDEQKEVLEYLISKFQMMDFIDKYPNQSSLGEKQRVAIARAVILKPKFLLLDEITSALDYFQSKNVFDVLANIKQYTTILLVSHDLFNPVFKGDYHYFLLDGQIKEDGANIIINPVSVELKNYLHGAHN